MTEDQQSNQQQQHQQQQQQQSSPKEQQRKTNINDIRNQDFVSRLLAATPPYLYSAPVGPNNFFFSDMLRSLVQAKNNENARNIQLQQAAMSRRPRKRSWSQHRPYYEHLKERKEIDDKTTVPIPEKPLELTTSKQLFPIASKYSKNLIDTTTKENHHQHHLKIPSHSAAISQSQQQHQQQSAVVALNDTKHSDFSQTNQITNVPSADPPPLWYPSLYPPYGIDPLHFFIDLRVSGHIYDRKKDNLSPLVNNLDNNLSTATSTTSTTGNSIEKYSHRHGSAFTVPVPRYESKSASAINLSTASSSSHTSNNNNNVNNGNLEKIENYSKYYDLGDSKENLQSSNKTTNYVLQHLPRLYNQFNTRDSDDNKSIDDDNDGVQNYNRDESGNIDVELSNESPDDEEIIHQID